MTQSMSMVEKVAIAIAERRPREKRTMTDEGWVVDIDYEPTARAAIEAMREPTKQMVLVGYDKINENIDSWNYESDSGFCVEDIAPTQTWQAMIDTALNENGGNE